MFFFSVFFGFFDGFCWCSMILMFSSKAYMATLQVLSKANIGMRATPFYEGNQTPPFRVPQS